MYVCTSMYCTTSTYLYEKGKTRKLYCSTAIILKTIDPGEGKSMPMKRLSQNVIVKLWLG